MRVSVLASTFDGEKYVAEQLESLLAQSRRPDEVVIVDDRSADRTAAIAREFIEAHGLAPAWSVRENPENLGWRVSFIRGLQHVSGDIVFFCDQDDVWFPDKIAVFERLLEANPAANVLASRETLWESGTAWPEMAVEGRGVDFLELASGRDEYLIRTSGCCMAVRMAYAEKVLPYCFDGWAHDDFFWKMALLDGSLAYLEESSILHRITGRNESRRRSTRGSALRGSDIDIGVAGKLLERLERESIRNAAEKRALVRRKLEGARLRKRMLETRSPLAFARLALGHADVYRRKRQLFGDFLRAWGVMK